MPEWKFCVQLQTHMSKIAENCLINFSTGDMDVGT
jgi:hypothetical protein